MGYTTDFDGGFEIKPKLKKAHLKYLQLFNNTRRMKRDTQKAESLADPARVAADLPLGEEGAYFVGAEGFAGQDRDESIIDYNQAPSDQPGLWCQWIPDESGKTLIWDGGEKFYEYVEWLQYLIDHFFSRWGYVLNGTCDWQGEESGDFGCIKVENNQISVAVGRREYGEFEPA